MRKAAILVAGISAAVLALGALVYLLGTAAWNPLDGVEAEILFEASRLRSGMALYVDPLHGAFDYGPPPSRFYALYTPFWAAFLSFLPLPAALTLGRVLSVAAWGTTLATLAATAPRRRLACALWGAAAFGHFFLVRGAIGARADAIAVALASFALVRTVRANRMGPGEALLFVAAAFLKPNVIGLATGAFVVDAWRRRWGAIVPVAVAVVAIVGLGGALQWGSHGAWIAHMVRSSMQPHSAARFWEQVGTRFVFLGAPHAVVLAIAFTRRTGAVTYASGAAAASLAWTIFAMSKSGSATNYWLEPTAGALVVLGYDAWRPLTGWSLRAVEYGGATLLVMAAATSAPTLLTWWRQAQTTNRAIARAKAVCRPAADRIVLASDPALELEMNGRVVETPFQTTWLVRQGLFPLETWRSDLVDEHVRCLCMWGTPVEPSPPTDPEARRETGVYQIELRDDVNRLFTRAFDDSGLFVYERN